MNKKNLWVLSSLCYILMMDYNVINTVKCNDYGTCGINIKQAEKDESLNSISNGTI